MKNVSVIGATGMLGAPVAKQLLKDGFDVRVITRDIKRAQHKLGSDFEYAEADLPNVSSLKTALDGTDAVHLNLSGHSKQSYYQQHVIGTQNVLKAVEGKTMDCISMISSASAYPEFNDRWDNRYKLEAEMLLKASGQPYLAFLPSWFMESLPMFQQKNKILKIGPSTKPIHWVSAADYAKVVSQAYQDPERRNQRISIYGPEAITMAEAINKYAHLHTLKIQSMPVWLTKIIGKLIGDESLVDVADLMAHYDRTGEKTVDNTVRTTTHLNDWLKGTV